MVALPPSLTVMAIVRTRMVRRTMVRRMMGTLRRYWSWNCFTTAFFSSSVLR